MTLKEGLARRFWGLIAWNSGINPTTDGVPITFDDDKGGHRAFCKTLASVAVEYIKSEEG